MATLNITDAAVTVRLHWWEKMAALRSHLTVPRRAITSVRVLDDAFSAVGPGKRSPATKIPGLSMVGTVLDSNSVQGTFVACKARQPGLEIKLTHPNISRIVLSTKDAEKFARELAGFPPIKNVF